MRWRCKSIKQKSEVDQLLEKLQSEDVGVRRSAVWALRALGDKAAVPVLQDVANDVTESFEIRTKANDSLKKLED